MFPARGTADLFLMPNGSTSPSDSGMSLVEVVVAMVLATAMLTALASNLISALQAAAYARHVQSAGDLLMKQVEELRAVPWETLGHPATGLGSDPTLTLSGGVLSAPVLAGVEPVVLLAAGAAITQHIRSVTLPPALSATTRTYVTSPAGCLCRRLQVSVSWSERGQPKTRSTSTLVYGAVPVGRTAGAFALGASTLTVPDAPRGSWAPVGALLSNDGQQQSFQLTAAVTSGATVLPWAVVWHADPNRNGLVDVGEVRLDAGSPGTAALGVVASGTTVAVNAVVAVPSTGPTGPVTVAVTATSPADPGARARAAFSMRVT